MPARTANRDPRWVVDTTQYPKQDSVNPLTGHTFVASTNKVGPDLFFFLFFFRPGKGRRPRPGSFIACLLRGAGRQRGARRLRGSGRCNAAAPGVGIDQAARVPDHSLPPILHVFACHWNSISRQGQPGALLQSATAAATETSPSERRSTKLEGHAPTRRVRRM